RRRRRARRGLRRDRAAVVWPEVARHHRGNPGRPRRKEGDPMSIRVLDPRLDPEGEAPRMAPPLASLDGATVGLLDNAKIGTERFFDHLEAMLRAKNGI